MFQYVAHFREPGVICWRIAAPTEIQAVLNQAKSGRQRTCDPVEVLHCIAAHPGRSQSYYNTLVGEVLECSEQAVQRAVQTGVNKGWLRFTEKGRTRLYRLTESGQKTISERPSTNDWDAANQSE